MYILTEASKGLFCIIPNKEWSMLIYLLIPSTNIYTPGIILGTGDTIMIKISNLCLLKSCIL